MINLTNRLFPFNIISLEQFIDDKKDIHVYVDTSGSLSEHEYGPVMKYIIAFAKQQNVNISFSSFTTELSPVTKLDINDSTEEMYNTFLNTEKDIGGTDFEPVWQDCLENNNDKLVFIISDMDYSPPTNVFKHPNNLYYIPTNGYPKFVTEASNQFITKMKWHNYDLENKMVI